MSTTTTRFTYEAMSTEALQAIVHMNAIRDIQTGEPYKMKVDLESDFHQRIVKLLQWFSITMSKKTHIVSSVFVTMDAVRIQFLCDDEVCITFSDMPHLVDGLINATYEIADSLFNINQVGLNYKQEYKQELLVHQDTIHNLLEKIANDLGMKWIWEPAE